MRKYTKMHLLFEDTASTLSIDLETNQVLNWLFNESVETDYKTRDECLIKFEKEGKFITYQGYIPHFFPNEHYGDYLMLKINAKGIVQDLNVTDEQIDEFLTEMKQYNFLIEEE